jgi:hypothetical protein
MSSTIDGGLLEPGIGAVLYDNESWTLTPTNEQHDPGTYVALAAGIAHQHGLVFIAAPAMDLVTVLGQNPGESRANAYLRLGLAKIGASRANVINIQAQSLESSMPSYSSFVSSAQAQARSANPNVVVLAGLSTNPSGVAASPQTLYEDVKATRSVVNGYWLNVPGSSPECPNCGTPRGDIAVQFLQLLIAGG